MPAWTPDMEGLVPFDDEDGINQELPSELAQFLQQFEVSRQFTVEVKLWKNELYAGRPALVGRLEGMVPDYSSVVRLNGPGHYGFDTTWVPKNGKAITKMLKVSLVGSQWDQIYKDAQKEKKKFELEEAKHEAELDRVKNGGQPIIGTYKDPAASGREYMKSMLGDMKDLAETFGFGIGGAKGGGAGQEMGMPMMMMGMMQMMMKASENSTNLLVTVLTNQNKGNDLQSTVGLFKEIMGVRDGLMPKDKHWIEEIVGALADNLPSIAGLFMRGNPEDDPMHQKMNEGLAETRERAQEDPNFAKALVKHMDKKVGPKMTEKILKGFLNIKRPEAPASPGAQTPPKTPPDAGTAPSGVSEGQ